ncbi:MAG: hypothetical protein DRO10_01720 [Thermoprotei archaeon]|nr:MAG: hypothetical protein DRO10_01720 [Thermoprotei archaeon]
MSKSLKGLLTLLRLPPAAAEVLSTLLTERKALTLTELTELTGYAKSHISTALQMLEGAYLVERSVYGKKHVFKARVDVIQELITKHLIAIRTRISQALSEIDVSTKLYETLQKIDMEFDEIIKKLEERERN